jgi:hypothetical protein
LAGDEQYVPCVALGIRRELEAMNATYRIDRIAEFLA